MNLILLNEDNLSSNHPVFQIAEEDGYFKTVFIFDEDYLNQTQYSFKRIVFIYECLKQIDCEIYKGATKEVIDHLAPKKIFIPNTINPFFNKTYSKLSKAYQIEIINQTKLIELENQPDLKRFFRYWNKAKKQLKKVYN